jgi:alpha-galactosidase
MTVLKFGNLQIIAGFDDVFTTITGEYILIGTNVSLQIPSAPQAYYSHGWQSWSLAAWTDLQALPAPKPSLLNPMQVDPVYVHHPAPNGSWVGAVDFEDGNILLLGALALDSHVQLRDGALQGWYETGRDGEMPNEWFAGYGPEAQVFNAYAQLISKRLGTGRVKRPYRVWCSWYSLYTAIDEDSLQAIFAALGDLPFDVLQVDDGWQSAIGDWQSNPKFPSGMTALAENIKATGRKAGLWLAPLLVVPSSKTYQEHPDWLLRNEQGQPVSAGFNWGEQLYALDTTHPDVLNWLEVLMKQVRAWGFDYIKLDFLYAGALPGKRHISLPRETAYRHGLQVIRAALGEDAYFLTCGAPVLPSIGLCDAMRIGPDVAAEWESYRDAVLLKNPTTPGAKNAVRTSLNRLWLAPLVHTDPDVAYFRAQVTRLTPSQNAMLQDLALVCNFKATSDLPQWLTEAERERLCDFLNEQPKIERCGRYSFTIDQRRVDFSPAMDLPTRSRGLTGLLGALTGWLGSQPFVLGLLNQLGKQKLEKLKAGL